MPSPKRYAMHIGILILMVAMIYIPSVALISFTGKATGEQFAESARIGTVPVGGLSHEEAEKELGEEITAWSKQTPLTTGQGEETTPIPTELVSFDVKQSVEQADAKKGGKLVVVLDETKIETYLAEAAYTPEQGMAFRQWLTASSSVLAEATFDPSEQVKTTETTVATVNFSTRSDGEETMVEAMADIEIKPGAVFNMKSFGNDFAAASFIGSKLYELFAKTPFEIVERMQNDVLPDGITLGYDVRVDEKIDFAVRNTTASPYRLVLTPNGSDVTAELKGPALTGKIEAVLESEKTIPYRTITRYSALLSPGTTTPTQSGIEGKSIELYRVTQSAEGERRELVALDFYAPTPEIVTKSSQAEPEPIIEEPVEEPADESSDEPLDEMTDEELLDEALDEEVPVDDGLTDPTLTEE